jgi:HD-like signal output (HDOD) protein
MTVTRGRALEELIERTVSVPTIPAILMRVDRILASPESSAPDVAQAISNDPALASKVLRIANSAYYGLKAQVTSLDLAVALLGFKVIRNIVVTATLLDTFSGATRDTPLRPEEFWTHSLRAAVGARMIHMRFLKGDRAAADEAYVAGLLHDLGKLVLLDGKRREYYDLIQGAHGDGGSLSGREQEQYGFDHSDVGAVLARRWNLPESIISAIGGHHDPESDEVEPRAAALAHVADYVALTRGRPLGFSGADEPFVRSTLQTLGLSAADLSQMVFLFETEDRGLEFPFGMS